VTQHICIITTAHPLDDVRVYSKVALSFLEQGFQVSWVGPEVYYFSGPQHRDARISYALTPPIRNRLQRLTSVRRVARRARGVQAVDWYYAPDPDAAEAAIRLATGSASKVLFDIHEVFHGTLLDRWLFGRRAPLVRDLVRRRIARTASASDLVMAVSDSVLRLYADPAHPQVVVRNCAPRWFAHDVPNRTDNHDDDPTPPTTIFMHGKSLTTNGTQVVLEALAHLGGTREHARVILMRSLGPERPPFILDLEERIESLDLGQSVQQHDAVTHNQMPLLLRKCDVGIIAYGRGLGRDSLPNRLFEYMAAGLAILAPSYSDEIRRIVESERIGRVVDFEKPEDVADAMKWFIDHPHETRAMGERARAAFSLRHNWTSEFEKLTTAMGGV